MGNKVVAIDNLTIDLLKSGKIDQAIMMHENRHGDPKIIEPFRRKTCSVDLLIGDLLLAGKLEAAIEVFERYSEAPEILNSFTRKTFFNRARTKLIPLMLKRSNQIDSTIAPVILRNQVTLAEMAGSTLTIAEALKKFDQAFDDASLIELKNAGDSALTNAANAALGLFDIPLAIRITHLIHDQKCRTKLENSLENYFTVCRAADFNPNELPLAAQMIRQGNTKKVNEQTVVVRVTPNIWNTLSKEIKFDTTNLPDGFVFAKHLKEQGYTVVLAPQLSLPGPSLHSPFSQEQKFPIAFVDSHKYSKRGKFVHYKSISNGCLQIERGGYSGWSEITAYPNIHNFESVDPEKAKSFSDTARLQIFGDNINRPKSFDGFGKFAVIPLQIPGDSVQRLSKFTFAEMIDNSIRFFASKGLNVVLRRHPQCQDREITDYLSRTSKVDGVFISELSTRDLIYHSEAVALCNSSVGWDAILAHKPLFCFGLAEYSRAAYQVEEISDLEEIESMSKIVNTTRNDQLYYYFWNTQVTKGTKAALHKVSNLVNEILTEQKN